MPFACKRLSGFGVLLALALCTGAAVAGEFEKSFTFDCEELVVRDLVGAIKVEAARGDDYEVIVRVRGADAEADLIDFTVDEGRSTELIVEFPLDDHSTYIYPDMGRNSSSTISAARWTGEDASWLKKIGIGKGARIKVKGRGRGLEMWADITIKVPKGGDSEIYIGVGSIEADDVEADLRLDTASGDVAAIGIEGNLVVDTGSGGVEVRKGAGEKFLIDTGSGGVLIDDVKCRELVVDTGSGGVEAAGISADDARIDTGSGSVDLQLDRMGDGNFVVDTGSGSIEVILPGDASADIEADTGSGRVRVHVDDAKIRTKERDNVRLIVGDGEARVRLDAGSGSITIRQ